MIDPNAGEVRFGGYAEQWVNTRLVKGRPLSLATRQGYRGLLRRNLLPAFEAAPLRTLTPEVVRTWHAELIESAGRDQAAKSYRLIRAIMNTTVEDPRIRQGTRAKSAGAGASKRPNGP